MTPAKKNILVIRFSSIGDIVLTTPIIRCLSKQLDANVYLLTKTFNESWIKHNPYIHKIISFDNNASEVLDELRFTDFHAVIDLHKNLRSKKFSRVVDALYFDFNKENINKWLLVNFKIDRMPDRHIVDRYFDAVSSLGVVNDGQGLDMFIPEGMDVDQLSIEVPTEYIVIALGASYATKRMDTAMLRAFASSCSRSIILVGGKDVATMAEHLSDLPNVINAVGQLSIIESALLIRESLLVVSGDSAMMHIAAAFQKKMIAIWGSTTPRFGMEPYYGSRGDQHLNIQVEDLNCRPCSKLGYDTCPKGHFKCMKDIGAANVVDAVDQLIGR